MAIQNPNIPTSVYSGQSTQTHPSLGCRLYEDDSGAILLGQPPEVLKGLLLPGVTNFDTLVLPDV